MKICLLYHLTIRNVLLDLRKFEEEENGPVAFRLVLNEKYVLDYR